MTGLEPKCILKCMIHPQADSYNNLITQASRRYSLSSGKKKKSQFKWLHGHGQIEETKSLWEIHCIPFKKRNVLRKKSMSFSWSSLWKSAYLLLENSFELRFKKKKIWCHQVEMFCIAEKTWQSGSAWISSDILALKIVVETFFPIIHIISWSKSGAKSHLFTCFRN